MLGFCFKKWLYSVVDNLLPILTINIITTSILSILFALTQLLDQSSFVTLLLENFIGCTVYFIFLGIVLFYANDIIIGKKIQLKSVKKHFLNSIKYSSFLGFLVSIFISIIPFALLYYSAQNTIISLIPLVFLSLVTLTVTLVVMWIPPLYSLQFPKSNSVIKKSLTFFMDNSFFSLLVFFWGLVFGGFLFFFGAMYSNHPILIAATLITLLIFPGMSGISLWLMTTAEIRLLQYDYLQKHPETKPGRIPWKEVLAPMEKRVGSRTLRSIVFPWKQ